MRRRTITFLSAILIVLAGSLAGSEASAATFYVSPSGNDSNPGTITAPFATTAQAVTVAQAGDTIYLRAGTYTFTQPLNVTTNNLTIASYPGETGAITGTINDINVLLYMIFITSNNVSLIGLDISGGSYYGVKLQTNTGTVIQNCNIHDNGCDNIKMYLSDNVLFEGNQMGPNGERDNSDAQCINAVACDGAEVRNNYFHDSAQNGLYFKGGSTGCVVEQNLVVNSGYAGILLGQDTDLEFMRDGTQFEAINCIARNNIVVNAGGCGIGTWSGNNLDVENNTLYNVAQTYNGGLYNCTNSRNVPSQQITFKNNIVVVTSSRTMFYCIDISDQLLSDYNLYVNPNGSYPFWMETPSTGNYWTNINDWQSGMSADLHSITTENAALDSTSNYYKPESGSPALGAGIPMANVTNDYAGNARPAAGPFDIGAWQMSQPVKTQPQVSVNASATSGSAPLTVSFAATVTDPGATVASYNWSFGDGQTSSQAAPSHVYSSGSFTASLSITDSTGSTASASVAINVSAPAPQAPQVAVVPSTTSGTSPLPVNFTSNVTDPGSQITSYSWNFGDGQTSSAASPSHTYSSAGTFTAKLVVTNSSGLQGTAAASISVQAPSAPTGVAVIWNNVVGCSVNQNNLTKTAATEWGDAGAGSGQSIGTGNGYVLFSVAEKTTQRIVGLSNKNYAQAWGDLAFGILLSSNGTYVVNELGQQPLGNLGSGSYTVGDIFKVAIESGIVNYYKNGALIYTSAYKPSYPLWAGAILGTQGATVDGAMISSSSDIGVSVQIASPAPQQVVKTNSSVKIGWAMTGTSGAGGTTEILFSLNGGATWSTIAMGIPGSTNSYTWSVATAKTKTALVRVVWRSPSGALIAGTSGIFTVKAEKQAK